MVRLSNLNHIHTRLIKHLCKPDSFFCLKSAFSTKCSIWIYGDDWQLVLDHKIRCRFFDCCYYFECISCTVLKTSPVLIFSVIQNF